MDSSDSTEDPAPDALAGAGPLLRGLDRWVGRLTRALALVGVAIVLLLTALTGYSVFWRYVLDRPISWIDELSGYLVVLLVMVGVAEALRRGDHINVDLMLGRLGRRGRRAVAVWSMLAVIAVAVVLLIDGINAVIGVYTMGLISEGYLEMPMWIPQSAIILGSAMLIVTALLGLIRALAGYPADDRPEG
jgi:C4-dicarboxylate transporter DctQ subunit